MAKKVQLKSEMTFETSKLRRGLKQGEQMIKTSAGKMSSSLAAIGVGLGAGAGIAGLAGVADQFDRIGKLSTRFNVGVESLQRLGHAAKLSGANIETVAKAMNVLVQRSREAPMAKEFQALGIQIEEFQQLNPEQMFLEFADAIAKSKDSNEAMAVSLRILGEEAGELMPMLKAGGKAIQEMAEGINALDEQSVRQIEMFNDALERLKETSMVLSGGLLAGLARQLERLAGTERKNDQIRSLQAAGASPEVIEVMRRAFNYETGDVDPDLMREIGKERDDQRAKQDLEREAEIALAKAKRDRIMGRANTLRPAGDPVSMPMAAAFGNPAVNIPGMPFGMGLSVAMGLQGMEAQSKLAMGAVQVRNTKFNEQKKDSLNLERITKATEDTAVALKNAL